MKELDILINALQISPENHVLRRHIAKIQYDEGLYEEANENYIRLYEADRADLKSLEGSLKALAALEKFDDARKLVEYEAASRSDWSFGLFILAQCFYFYEDYDEAMMHYEKAVDMSPELEDEDFHRKLLQHTSSRKTRLKVLDFPDVADWEDDFVKPRITFNEVGGMEAVKENIRLNIIFPFSNQEIYKAYGESAGGGILLFGPPGCGKTFISMATAGECKAHFISISISDILDMYIGESEKNLHTIFETARLKSPAIIFIDEIDAIGGSRQSSKTGATRTLTNQLLMEMDSTHHRNKNLLVIGATNTPWAVDSALRRPGRFDRVIFIPPPDLHARADIIKLHMQEKPKEEIDYVLVSKNMNKYSGADIKGVCDIASQNAIKTAMQTGKIVPIRTEDLLHAIKSVRPSTAEWLSMARNYATYSNQSGIYDDVLNYLKLI